MATGQDSQRRLAGILVADVVGYSRLMGVDEAGTLAALAALRAELIDPSVAGHHGRIVKEMGDGLLVEFPSVVEAVQCAVDVQRAIAGRNADTPVDRRIELRIGVNLGDVIAIGDDIYGDGVNVAARLEALADPGGVCISRAARDQVRDKLDVELEDMGHVEVKNIARPIRVFRIAPLRVAQPAPDASALPLPAKPSIAVLAFDNMSGDPDQEYFADGISEDIITALSRVRWFFVIARNSSFTYKGRSVDVKQVARELGVRYVLEGSVRKAGERVRITAQLVDGASGQHVWARRYDRELSDIFAVQDEITETIVGAIEPELGRAERERVKAKRPGNLDAWDLCQRGMSRLYHYTADDLRAARDLFRQAIALDATLGPAHSGLAEAYYYEIVYGFSGSLAVNREKAIEPARRAVALDAEDAGARCTLGRVHYLRREHDAAILELEAALDLNPSLALAHYGIGAALVFSGRAAESFPHLETAIRLSPHDPNMGSFLVRSADAKYLMGEYEDAAAWALKALRQPNFQWSRHAVLLAALGQLGRADEARTHLEEVTRRRPDFSVSFVRDTHLFNDAGDFEHYQDGLRKAGVPEGDTAAR